METNALVWVNSDLRAAYNSFSIGWAISYTDGRKGKRKIGGISQICSFKVVNMEAGDGGWDLLAVDIEQ